MNSTFFSQLAVEQSWLLAALLLALLPLLNAQLNRQAYSHNALLPTDPLSLLIDWGIRGLTALALAALILGMAGLHQREHSVEHIGQGAEMVLLLDRSRSMDNTFAGRTPSGDEASKAEAARGLLDTFVDQRPNDRIGMVAYSTAPLFVLPITGNRAAIHAGIQALSLPGLAFTHISKGLLMALSFFQDRPLIGSRIVLLVSDGAAAIDAQREAELRQLVKAYGVRIYWIFLRTAHSPGIFDAPDDPRKDNPSAMPERYLHKFFNSLGTPYQAYEAESAAAMQRAIADIGRLENAPIHYQLQSPRRDLSGYCYALAGLCIGLLMAATRLEAKPV